MSVTKTRDGHLTAWKNFNNYQPEIGASFFQLKDIKDVNRFAARFRAANCFRGINLEGYTEKTVSGYSALFRVTLTWSAFEVFREIINIPQTELGSALEKHGEEAILKVIRQNDQDDKFYKFIHDHVTAKKLKRELDKYFQNDPCSITYLAAAIRHIFAHGWLSPNANRTNPKAVVIICDTVCNFLLTFMDKEFSQRVLQAEEAIEEIAIDSLLDRED